MGRCQINCYLKCSLILKLCDARGLWKLPLCWCLLCENSHCCGFLDLHWTQTFLPLFFWLFDSVSSIHLSHIWGLLCDWHMQGTSVCRRLLYDYVKQRLPLVSQAWRIRIFLGTTDDDNVCLILKLPYPITGLLVLESIWCTSVGLGHTSPLCLLCLRWKYLKDNKKSPCSKLMVARAQETTSVGKGVEKEEPSCTVGGNANCCSHSWKQHGGSSKS